jgi:hypothetical protein
MVFQEGGHQARCARKGARHDHGFGSDTMGRFVKMSEPCGLIHNEATYLSVVPLRHYVTAISCLPHHQSHARVLQIGGAYAEFEASKLHGQVLSRLVSLGARS